jgi:CheY-like chemotaxis protein
LLSLDGIFVSRYRRQRCFFDPFFDPLSVEALWPVAQLQRARRAEIGHNGVAIGIQSVVEALMSEVLVVDDSQVVRDTVRAMLEQAGYSVSEATNGVEGLAALRASASPMVVLLDYQMPEMDGEEVLETVAGDGGPLAEHEYIIITANQATFPESFIELLRHLSIRVLGKPFKPGELVGVVEGATVRLSAQPEPIPALPEM